MQNDVLKNNVAPWQEKGRWYHMHVTEAGVDAANTDKFLNDHMTSGTNSGYFIWDIDNMQVVDLKFILHEYDGPTAINYNPLTRIRFSPKKIDISWLTPQNFTKLDVDYWLFIVEI